MNMTSKEVEVVTGSITAPAANLSYSPGPAENAYFSRITSFVQYRTIWVIMVDQDKNCFSASNRRKRETELIAGDQYVPADGSAGGLLTDSLFDAPESIVLTSSNSAYVTVASGICLLDFSVNGGYTTYVPLDITPRSLVFHSGLNLLFMATAQQIFSYNPANGTTTNLTATPTNDEYIDGPFEKATFSRLSRIAMINEDTLLVVDTGNQRLRVIDLNRYVVSSICTSPGISSGGNITHCSVSNPTSVTYFSPMSILVGTINSILELSCKYY